MTGSQIADPSKQEVTVRVGVEAQPLLGGSGKTANEGWPTTQIKTVQMGVEAQPLLGGSGLDTRIGRG
jgi:hypothetical protein